MHRQVSEADRLAARHRPEGQPVMHQNWGKLHFMHWRINEDLLRPLIHPDLQIDTFGGSAWIAIAPFTMWDVRGFPPYIPAIPGLSSMHELNVRTYVHLDGVPGVWFFSLDIDNSIAAVAARTFYHLPYYTAEIDLVEDGKVIEYELRRDEEPAAEFSASFRVGKKLPTAQSGSREFFLTERYLLYTEHDGELYRARIHHQPWPLQESVMEDFSTNLFEANGIFPPPAGEPMVHYAEEVNVDIWVIEKVSN
jgi:uncharacterized protein YqjF (DUF2071 family)